MKKILFIIVISIFSAILVLTTCKWLSVVVLIIVLFLFLPLFAKYLCRWWKGSNRIISSQHADFLKMLASSMGVLFSIGSILFLFAQIADFSTGNFQFYGSLSTNAEVLLGAMINSLDLFMLDIDNVLLNKLEGFHVLKGLIYIVATLSFICTIAFLISLVYERIIELYKLRRLKSSKHIKEHLYIFWGVNDASQNIIETMKACEREKSTIIFVDESETDEREQGAWMRILSLFKHERRSFSRVKEYRAFITIINTKLSEVVSLPCNDILGNLNMPTTKSIIEKLNQRQSPTQLHVFFLSSDAQENIDNMNALIKDCTIATLSIKNTASVRFYCHAPYNARTQILEDNTMLNNIRVKIVDSSKLSIELLKRDVCSHPASFLEFNKESNPGTITSSFNALIVGFGETGREAFRFLYEYSALTSEESTDTHTKRCQFHCTVVDKDMDMILPHFTNGVPAIFNRNSEDCSFSFLQTNYTSKEFYDAVMSESSLKDLNYVVVSLGNDDEGIKVVSRLLKQVIKYKGSDICKFRIYLRVFNQSKVPELQEIADYYNRTISYVGKDKCVPLIQLFGKPKDIFTYNIVVDDWFEKRAEMFYDRYQEIYAENEPLLTTGSWSNRRKLLLGKERLVIVELPSDNVWKRHVDIVDNRLNDNVEKDKEFVVNDKDGDKYISAQLKVGFEPCNKIPRYKDIIKLHRQESQDMSNILHASTKIFIYKLYKTTEIDVEQLKRNLAIAEHMRWNAAHEMLGYIEGDEKSTSCDDLKKTHHCLVPWEKLDAVSNDRKYSYKNIYPFAKTLIDKNPELKKYLSQGIWVYVDYKPNYQRYDTIVVETTLSLWKNGKIDNVTDRK